MPQNEKNTFYSVKSSSQIDFSGITRNLNIDIPILIGLLIICGFG